MGYRYRPRSTAVFHHTPIRCKRFRLCFCYRSFISSTLVRLYQITENSHAVRIIPSLSGGLYKFDGDFIEPIPVNVDSLLKSYSDEVDITGKHSSVMFPWAV